jgi:hypothetical protein
MGSPAYVTAVTQQCAACHLAYNSPHCHRSDAATRSRFEGKKLAQNLLGGLVPHSSREVLTLLHKELAFVERDGYGDAASWEPLSIFLDSPFCPNRPDSERSTPCAQCWLFNFVPERFRQELPSCHFIPLNCDGESVHSMGGQYSPAEVKEKLKSWLEAEIRHLEELDMAEGHAL